MQYDFATAIRIIFGPETGKDIAGQKAEMGCHGLDANGQSRQRVASLVEWLKLEKMQSVSDWLRVLAALSEHERRGFIVGGPRFFAVGINPHIFLFSKATGDAEYA